MVLDFSTQAVTDSATCVMLRTDNQPQFMQNLGFASDNGPTEINSFFDELGRSLSYQPYQASDSNAWPQESHVRLNSTRDGVSQPYAFSRDGQRHLQPNFWE